MWSSEGTVYVDGNNIAAPADTWNNTTSYAKGATVIYGGKKYTANQANQGQMPYYASSVWYYEGTATRRVHCKYSLDSSARYIYLRNTQSPEDFGESPYPTNPAPFPPYYIESSDVGIAFDVDKIYGEHSLDPIPNSVFERDLTRSYIKPVDPNTDIKPPRPNPPVIITAEIMATVYGSSDRENNTSVPWFMLAMVCSRCEDYEMNGVEYDFQLVNGEEILLSFTGQSSNTKYYTWNADGSNSRVNIETLYEFLMDNEVGKVTDLSVKIRAIDSSSNATVWATKAITFSYAQFILLKGDFLSTPVLSGGFYDFEVKKAFYKNLTPSYRFSWRVKYHYDDGQGTIYDSFKNWNIEDSQSSPVFHVDQDDLPYTPGQYETVLGIEFSVQAVSGSATQLWSESFLVS